jgi:hypothetical protein
MVSGVYRPSAEIAALRVRPLAGSPRGGRLSPVGSPRSGGIAGTRPRCRWGPRLHWSR